MAPKVDFVEASRRHHSDAELLSEEGRKANAGHLFGLAAECGIKALIIALGFPVDADGDLVQAGPPPLTQARKHINEWFRLQNQMIAFLSGRNAAKYGVLLVHLADFQDWQIAHRYWREADIPASLTKWQSAADEVQRMMQQLQLDGLI